MRDVDDKKLSLKDAGVENCSRRHGLRRLLGDAGFAAASLHTSQAAACLPPLFSAKPVKHCSLGVPVLLPARTMVILLICITCILSELCFVVIVSFSVFERKIFKSAVFRL